ncbi:MAG TPA: hypothetical protein G4O00_06905 [Thermoflexia bacterium]|nr:hypothetical protein [Thermoflexia bacterium]
MQETEDKTQGAGCRVRGTEKKGRGTVAVMAVVAVMVAAMACNAPTPTPSASPTPFVAPTFTPTPTPPAPPTPTPPPPTATPQEPAANIVIDFETWGTWRRGDQPNGTFEQSNEQVYGGQFAGRLAYHFPTPGNDFVVFVHPAPIPGTPDRIHAWVYGDGAGHFFNLWIRDAEGEIWQVPLGRVEHTGWRQMEGRIETGQEWPWDHISGPSNGAVDYPIEFYAVVLDDGEDTFVGDGVIFVDEITVP